MRYQPGFVPLGCRRQLLIRCECLLLAACLLPMACRGSTESIAAKQELDLQNQRAEAHVLQDEDPTAPPSDAKVIQDATGKGQDIIEVIPSDRPGNKSWSSVHDQYFWERGITIVKKSNKFGDQSDVRCKIGGFARYEITGGRYNYREFKTLWVEYEGIPRPSDEEVMTLIRDNLKDFLRGNAANMIHLDKLKIEIANADEQKYTWHSPTSLSLVIAVTADRAVNNTEVATERSLWECRLYRADQNSVWNRVLGIKSNKSKELSRVTMDPATLRATPRLSQVLSK